MPAVFVSIGTNVDREKYLRSAIQSLEKNFGQLTLSSVYETKAMGFEGPDFFNMVVAFSSEVQVEDMDKILDSIEAENGRTPECKKFSSRTLDLDLILYGDYISQSPELNIPRDEVLKYAFMLEPLAEIAGELTHPVVNKTYATLWDEYDKNDLQQQRIEFSFKG